jgi:hypothetical protein
VVATTKLEKLRSRLTTFPRRRMEQVDPNLVVEVNGGADG